MEQNLVKPGPKQLHSANWKPGQSGNENGRPVGVRNAFSTAFLADLRDVWSEHGRSAMEFTAKTQPAVFFATCARLCPANVQLSIEQAYPSGLGPDDLAILRAIKEAIPGADDRTPAEVLEYVRDTLRAASATTVEASSDYRLTVSSRNRPVLWVFLNVMAVLGSPWEARELIWRLNAASNLSPSVRDVRASLRRPRHGEFQGFPGIQLPRQAARRLPGR